MGHARDRRSREISAVFLVVEVYIGSFSALRRLGVYKVEEDNQAAEGNELSGNKE